MLIKEMSNPWMSFRILDMFTACQNEDKIMIRENVAKPTIHKYYAQDSSKGWFSLRISI